MLALRRIAGALRSPTWAAGVAGRNHVRSMSSGSDQEFRTELLEEDFKGVCGGGQFAVGNRRP